MNTNNFPDNHEPKNIDDSTDLLAKIARLLYDANLKGAEGSVGLDSTNSLGDGVVLDCIVPDPSVTIATITAANHSGAVLTGRELTQPIYGRFTGVTITDGFATGYIKRA